MPPKRIAKRRSPPEDALPKSKKVKGKLVLASVSEWGTSWSPQNLGLGSFPRHLKLRGLEAQEFHPDGGSLVAYQILPSAIVKEQRLVYKHLGSTGGGWGGG